MDQGPRVFQTNNLVDDPTQQPPLLLPCFTVLSGGTASRSTQTLRAQPFSRNITPLLLAVAEDFRTPAETNNPPVGRRQGAYQGHRQRGVGLLLPR